MTDNVDFSQFSSAEQWLESYEKKIQDAAARAAEVQGRLREVQGEFADEYVHVVVNPGGQLVSAQLTDAGSRRTAREAVDLVMTAYRKATAKAASRTMALMEEYAGEGSETVAEMRRQLPPEVVEEIETLRSEEGQR